MIESGKGASVANKQGESLAGLCRQALAALGEDAKVGDVAAWITRERPGRAFLAHSLASTLAHQRVAGAGKPEGAVSVGDLKRLATLLRDRPGLSEALDMAGEAVREMGGYAAMRRALEVLRQVAGEKSA